MSDEQNTSDGVNAPAIATVGVFSAVLTFAVIIGVQVLYYKAAERDLARKDTDPFQEVRVVLEEQDAQLTGDKAKARGAIPIDEAMELVSKELQASAAQTPPENPQPAGPKKVESKSEQKPTAPAKATEEPGGVTIDLDPKKE